jgi:hypothetical protein
LQKLQAILRFQKESAVEDLSKYSPNNGKLIIYLARELAQTI